MSGPDLPYDERYLAGIFCFNERDFFEAHEVWEDIWMDCTGPERRFYQALIQAAVALYHFRNGNLKGASKLYHSSRAYHEPYGSNYLGLDLTAFWNAMASCFQEVIGTPTAGAVLNDEAIPTIVLDPPPQSWPDPASFLSEDDS
jgi:predicted metal-dependent hydrolase